MVLEHDRRSKQYRKNDSMFSAGTALQVLTNELIYYMKIARKTDTT